MQLLVGGGGGGGGKTVHCLRICVCSQVGGLMLLLPRSLIFSNQSRISDSLSVMSDYL